MSYYWTSKTLKNQRRPKNRGPSLLLMVLALALLAGIVVLGFSCRSSSPATGSSRSGTEAKAIAAVIEPPAEPDNVFTWTIGNGDTLSAIFDRFELSRNAMYQILSSDEALLALDVLRPGHVLTFTLDEESRALSEMELFVHPGKRIIYRRVNDSGFEYEEIILPGIWDQELLQGEINGSFYLSAIAAGLTEGETATITDLFKDQLNFAREIRAGDRFQVIRSRQFVEGEMTGQSRVEGVRIFRRNHLHSAFLFEDGNYYDHKGESLVRAFLRYPTQQRYRVSSSFNPARRHPITGRVSPHNGVDFAMPTGTPVLSTGDGIVTRVLNHPFAGKYIEIQHGGQYLTRYLHLHRHLVRRGQRVKRGERIALSGNTGRSTGPHLHFELHINGRPVNPLTAKIPMASSVPREKMALFNRRVGDLVALMEPSDEQVARSVSSEARPDSI